MFIIIQIFSLFSTIRCVPVPAAPLGELHLLLLVQQLVVILLGLEGLINQCLRVIV